MDVHEDALPMPAGRETMVRRVTAGQRAKTVTAAFGVCLKPVNKWVARFRPRVRPVSSTAFASALVSVVRLVIPVRGCRPLTGCLSQL